MLIFPSFLKAALPKRWKSNDGTTIEVDTPYTLRAQELRDLYNSLQMKYLTHEERLDILLTLKHTVKVKFASFFTLCIFSLASLYALESFNCFHENRPLNNVTKGVDLL